MASADPITDRLDLFSDTVYREQAAEQLDGFLRICGKLPVQRSQIYGLRQIARQQPGQVRNFADHQCQRAEQKLKTKGSKGDRRLEAEIGFWKLVTDICGDPNTRRPDARWSVAKVGIDHLPTDLHENNIPVNRPGMGMGMDMDERQRRKRLRQQRKEWLERWTKAHVPAFFERFCTHALYRLHCSESTGTNHERT